MKIRGPLITLAAAAALGAGILLVNISQQPDPRPARYSRPPRRRLPRRPNQCRRRPRPRRRRPLSRRRPTTSARSRLRQATSRWTSRVEGDKAVAYACDGNTVESWLRGSPRSTAR